MHRPKNVIGKMSGKSFFWRPGCGWGDCIKMNLGENCGCLDYLSLTEGRVLTQNTKTKITVI
jgi:hypothetical protein